MALFLGHEVEEETRQQQQPTDWALIDRKVQGQIGGGMGQIRLDKSSSQQH